MANKESCGFGTKNPFHLFVVSGLSACVGEIVTLPIDMIKVAVFFKFWDEFRFANKSLERKLESNYANTALSCLLCSVGSLEKPVFLIVVHFLTSRFPFSVARRRTCIASASHLWIIENRTVRATQELADKWSKWYLSREESTHLQESYRSNSFWFVTVWIF